MKIDELIQKCINETINSLKANKMYMPLKSSSRKVEFLLYNYYTFKEAIKEKEIEIDDIRTYGIQNKSNAYVKYNAQPEFDIKSELEKQEETINHIIDNMLITNSYINRLERALDKVKSDRYYIIIQYKYFENKQIEEIAELLNIDTSTVNRNKRRLIDELKIILFSDDAITEFIGT